MDRDANELARALVAAPLRVAVVGGGWAGLAAAVESVQRGHAVTLFEMAPQLGGRARAVGVGGLTLDNGQHILIGAYVDTLLLLRTVGVDVDAAFLRTPLLILYPDGTGLRLAPGFAALAFARAVMRQQGWTVGERLMMLAAAAGWSARGFQCDPRTSVAALTKNIPVRVRQELIDPLCVAALNTPSSEASASVFLRILKDALFSGPGSADLLLPCVSLSDLLPAPALRWLERAGATLRSGHRVRSLSPAGPAWQLDEFNFDRVILACAPGESARLVQSFAPEWSRAAASLQYEPIVTVYLQSAGSRLPEPMLALREDAHSPAQFVFDRGQLGGPEGLLAFVVSGARNWVAKGSVATERATLEQARAVLGPYLNGPLHIVGTLTEKRATFRCTPNLHRAPMQIVPGVLAAGDHVAGPYPATLEAAVRSGLAAARGIG